MWVYLIVHSYVLAPAAQATTVYDVLFFGGDDGLVEVVFCSCVVWTALKMYQMG